MANNGNVQFRYLTSKPTTSVKAGSFYWILENGKNQLYFSPSTDAKDLLRLDNILGGSTNVGTNIVYLSDMRTDSGAAGTTVDTETGRVRPWTDDEWAAYVKTYADSEMYGNISNLPFSIGSISICGDREFICKASTIVYDKVEIDGVYYFKKKGTESEPCTDEDGNKIVWSETADAPSDAAVTSVTTTWEMFGKSLSKDLIAKIKEHTTIKLADGSDSHLTIEESENSDGGLEYFIKLTSTKGQDIQTIESIDTDVEQGNYVHVQVKAVDDDSDDNYVISSTAKVDTQSVATATETADGLATAKDVKDYVDNNKFELVWQTGDSDEQ